MTENESEFDIDVVMEEIGAFGKYHYKAFFFLMIPTIFSSMHATNFIFTAAQANYRCKVPDCDNITGEFQPSWLENAMPLDQKCSMYEMSNKPDNLSTCPAYLFEQNVIVDCEEYVFEEEGTFVEEMDIPCEDWKRTLIGTMHNIGWLICMPIVGYVSDKHGRRLALALSCFISGLMGVIKALSVNYAMFLSFELLEPVLGSGLFSTCYVLGVEILPTSTRVLGSIVIHTSFSIGQIAMGLIAWAVPHWKTLLFVIYAPSMLVLLYIYLIQDSNRWLLNKKRYQKLIDNLREIARMNGRDLPEKSIAPLKKKTTNITEEAGIIRNLSDSDTDVEKDPPVKIEMKSKNEIDSDTIEMEEEEPFKQFMKSRIMIIRTLKCCFWWISCIFSFYGMSINAVFLSGSAYSNFIYAALIELPANVVSYFTLKYVGRKKTMLVAFFFGGIFCIGFAFIPDGYEWASLLLYLLGKFFVSLSFNSIYLYTSELYPTPLRHTLLAMCSMVGRIGSILAPQTPLLASVFTQLPALLFGSACIISSFLLLDSPETLNIRLPYTVKEAENLSALKIKKTPKQ